MTNSIPLQVKMGLVALIEDLPGVSSCHLNRPQPVGENETESGPVVIIRQEESPIATENQLDLSIRMRIRIALCFSLVVGGPSLDEVSDPFLQSVHALMVGAARSLPGVQGIQFDGMLPEHEGDAGILNLFYTMLISVSQLDLTAVTP